MLIPFCFGAVLGGIASGRVGARQRDRRPVVDSWLNPTSALIGVIAVLTGAYLAAVYLAGDSVRAGLPDLARGVPRAGAAARAGRAASSRSAACWSCARTRARSTTG